MLSTGVFERFVRKANICPKTWLKNSATITEVENLMKQLFYSRLLDIGRF